MDIHSEDLAYWYLRLNGFLTIRNFIVHPDKGSNQETDVDLLGVRFPFRAENLRRPMLDDRLFRAVPRSYIVLCEVKSGVCALNGPWTRPERGNLNRVLHAVGAFSGKENEWIASEIQSTGMFENQFYRVSLVCFGRERSWTLAVSHPNVPQITWAECLGFIYDRFRAYRNEKASHGQWDDTGKVLWDEAVRFRRDRPGFIDSFQIS